MTDDAERGFAERDALDNGELAREMAQAAGFADARRVWLEIGLQAPDRRWDERASCLVRALGDVATARPATASDVDFRCMQVCLGQPELATLDHTRISAYMRQRLLNERPTIVPPSGAYVPVLRARAAQGRDGLPIWPWLLAAVDLRLKFQGLTALVALAAVGLLYGFDAHQTARRDNAYADAISALHANAYERAMDDAARFLRSNGIRRDERTSEMRAVYDSALAKWFVANAHTGALDRDVIGRYLSLNPR